MIVIARTMNVIFLSVFTDDDPIVIKNGSLSFLRVRKIVRQLTVILVLKHRANINRYKLLRKGQDCCCDEDKYIHPADGEHSRRD